MTSRQRLLISSAGVGTADVSDAALDSGYTSLWLVPTIL
jgi:hypothetical protein